MNDRIKELKISRNLTQEEFGSQIGLSKSGISNIENGTRAVSLRHVKLISKVFGISELWLGDGIGTISGIPTVDLSSVSDDDLLTELADRLKKKMLFKTKVVNPPE